MIGGTGIDVVHIPRVARLWNLFGYRFTSKFLSNTELKKFQALSRESNKKQSFQFLASR